MTTIMKSDPMTPPPPPTPTPMMVDDPTIVGTNTTFNALVSLLTKIMSESPLTSLLTASMIIVIPKIY